MKSTFHPRSPRQSGDMTRLKDEVRTEAQKLIVRHERYMRDLHDEFVRRNRRSDRNDKKTILKPDYWRKAPGFNPYLVRARASRIAHSIKTSLRGNTYSPRCAVSYSVAKLDGTSRSVSVFQVPDAAVSRVFYRNLLQKNLSKLSAYSFAYRNDLTVHDAIQHIASDIKGKGRVFVAEYDFSKYFDSILHGHIWRILEERNFLMNGIEKEVIKQFLQVPTLPIDDYQESSDEKRERGVPQGTSMSLFLANVAAWPLDRALERLGVGFARYADDTLIWSHDYGRICAAAESLDDVATSIGAKLNLSKSEGISLFGPLTAPKELASTKSRIDFVGYSFSSSGTGIRPSTMERIRNRISYLVYKNLLEEPKRGNFVLARFAPPVDRDYVVLIYQLRRYLYGDLSERKLWRYLGKTTPRIHYKGVMAFYPLVDEPGLLQGLDGWLLHTVWTSLRVRGRLIESAGYKCSVAPHGLSREELLDLRASSSGGSVLDLRLPSFVRMGKLLRRAAEVHGANAIAHRRSNRYYRGPKSSKSITISGPTIPL